MSPGHAKIYSQVTCKWKASIHIILKYILYLCKFKNHIVYVIACRDLKNKLFTDLRMSILLMDKSDQKTTCLFGLHLFIHLAVSYGWVQNGHINHSGNRK
jgi:hypothetical protein